MRTISLWAKVISSLKSLSEVTLNPPETPRSFPTSGFTTIDKETAVEEEELPDYKAGRFYPVHLGQVFENRYQVVTKLGFGSSSTTWLARDLKARKYVALKVYVYTSLKPREIPIYHQIIPRIRKSPLRGRDNIKRVYGSFHVTGPHGKHAILVQEAAQMSIRDMRVAFKLDGFDEVFVKAAIIKLLEAVDFLHTEAEVIHTDIHPGNMLLGVRDNDLLQKLEQSEISSPVTRKPVSSDRTIYLSRLMRPDIGPMLLSDLGEARAGAGPHAVDIMPLEYRAPETLLYVGWSYPIDIWSVGLTAWDLLESNWLFTARDDDGEFYDAAHLAQLIAALGPPPPEFLKRNLERKADFWDEHGKWLGLAPIPHDRTLENLETKLEDKSGFLKFIRRTLTWLPEQRPSAKELLQDPWLGCS
ncbi:kinase-like protein [Aspergillus crustosus]